MELFLSLDKGGMVGKRKNKQRITEGFNIFLQQIDFWSWLTYCSCVATKKFYPKGLIIVKTWEAIGPADFHTCFLLAGRFSHRIFIFTKSHLKARWVMRLTGLDFAAFPEMSPLLCKHCLQGLHFILTYLKGHKYPLGIGQKLPMTCERISQQVSTNLASNLFDVQLFC